MYKSFSKVKLCSLAAADAFETSTLLIVMGTLNKAAAAT